MNPARSKAVARDWASKTLAGCLLGFVLAIGCAGLFNELASSMPLRVRGQFAMWLMVPVWLGVLSGVYFFGSGKRAWVWLGSANLLLIAILAVLRFC